jgi:hypothetical protein
MGGICIIPIGGIGGGDICGRGIYGVPVGVGGKYRGDGLVDITGITNTGDCIIS